MFRSKAAVIGTGFIGPVHNEGFPDTFKQLFRAFYAAIEMPETASGSGLASYPTFEDGHREILLCEAILQSATERRWVDL